MREIKNRKAQWRLQEQDEAYRSRLEELKKEIAIGIEQAERGELIPGEEVFRRLYARNDEAALSGRP